MNIKERLNQMLARNTYVHGWTFASDGNGNTVQVPLTEARQAFIKELRDAEPNPVAAAQMLQQAWDDPGTMLALNAVRLEQVGNYIFSESTFMNMFFEINTLQPDEEPFYINETMQEIAVANMGEDGSPEMVRVVKPEARTSIALHFIASRKVRYKTLDVYRGVVSDVATRTFDIAQDLQFKLDRKHYDLLNAATSAGGCYGVFSYEQGRANTATRIYVPHSGIITTHLPTTNDFDMNDSANTTNNPNANGGLTVFGIAVLKAIQNYADKWANVLPDASGARLVPTGEIIVPASDIIAIADVADPAMDVAAQRIQEDINRDGYTSLQYLGRQWRFIADVTIPAGTCFPRFNMVPGKSYTKPSLDKEFVETNEEENWERRYQRKVYGACIVSQHRPRALRIKYIA